MREDSTVIQRNPNHCNLRPYEKNNKPKHAPPQWEERGEEEKKKMHNIEMSNVKLKTTG